MRSESGRPEGKSAEIAVLAHRLYQRGVDFFGLCSRPWAACGNDERRGFDASGLGLGGRGIQTRSLPPGDLVDYVPRVARHLQPDAGQGTWPLAEPAIDVFEDLWQLSHVTPTYLPRALSAAVCSGSA